MQDRPIRVQVEGHGIVEFPAGTSEQVMRDALLKLPKPTQPQGQASQPPSTGDMVRMGIGTAARQVGLDKVADWLPTIGGIGGGVAGAGAGMGVASAPGAIAGAAAGGAAGEAARQGINWAMGQEGPESVGQFAEDVALRGAVEGVSEGFGRGVPGVLKAAATQVYRGYLKPSLSQVDLPKAREIVATAMREMLPIGQAGEAKAKALISQLNNQVKALLNDAKTKGKTVDLHVIANKVRDWAKTNYGKPGSPFQDLEAAMKVADDIDMHWSLKPEAPAFGPGRVVVNPVEAQGVKQAVRQAAGDTAFGAERGAATEARKQGGRFAKEAIEAVVPGVKEINARESKVIDALDALTRAAGREENRNALMGVPNIISGMVGGATFAESGNPINAVLMTMVTRKLLDPAVASRAALYASRYAEGAGVTTATALRLGTLAAMREQEPMDANTTVTIGGGGGR